jgi:hypothetical protein
MGQEVDCLVLFQYFRRAHRHLRLIIVMLCAACLLQFASEARAQCAARDVLRDKLLKGSIKSIADVPVWKTITLGTFTDSLALRNALDTAGCNIGGRAAEILARPAFIVGSAKTKVELVAVSAVELGFGAETVTLAALYARARQLGFGIAAAEVGPQLRLQYLDQPVGEFLIIGMEPIETWSGEPVLLCVGNGGAGLALVGQDGRPDAEISAFSRFLFVRKPAEDLEKAAAFLPP